MPFGKFYPADSDDPDYYAGYFLGNIYVIGPNSKKSIREYSLSIDYIYEELCEKIDNLRDKYLEDLVNDENGDYYESDFDMKNNAIINFRLSSPVDKFPNFEFEIHNNKIII